MARFVGERAVACQPRSTPASSDAQGIGSGTPGDAAVGRCAPVDLRTPTGERIDLTGTWVTEKEGTRGGGIRQIGDCLWWSGGYPDPSEDAGRSYYQINVFRGTIDTDFTVDGEWADLRQSVVEVPLGGGGRSSLAIEFTTAGDTRLVYVGGSGQPFIEPGFREEQFLDQATVAGAFILGSPAP